MTMRWQTTLTAALMAVFMAFCGLPCGGLAAQAQAPDQAAFEELLKESALDRRITLSKVRDYTPANYLQQGGQELDAYWQSDKVKAAFDRHHKDIKNLVDKVTIDPRFGTLDTLLAQYKSFYDDSGLNEISDVFVQDSLRAIQRNQEAFIDKTLTDFGAYLNDVYGKTQLAIGNDLDRLVKKQFDYWPELTSKLAPLSVKPGDFQGSQRSEAPMAGFAGALMIIFRKQINSALTKVLAAKLAGRVASKFIPFVGGVLLLWDIYDSTKAKTQLETSLRDIFVAEYKAE